MNELELLNFVRDTSFSVVVVVLGFIILMRVMAFLDRRSADDATRAKADDAALGRQMTISEQQVEINRGLLKSVGELSQQIVVATGTISTFATSTSKAIAGLMESVADGNSTLAGKIEASLDQKTTLALKTIARVQETANAVKDGQSAMQTQLGELAKTIVDVADGMRQLQQLESAREGADEQFRDYLKTQLGVLTTQLTSAEAMLTALSHQSNDDKANSAGKGTPDETHDLVGVGAVGDAV